jgi:hypothetical protein
MSEHLLSVVLWIIILLASVISVEFGLSVAIVEIALGIFAGNFLDLHPTSWITFFAGFGGVLLTFLAGAEVDTVVMKEKFKESFLIGTASFFAPFLGAMAYCHWVLGWSPAASKIAGIALSTTSLAVVYAVLVETGLTDTKIGKIIMASCFITDMGTALALSLLFIEFNWFTLVFLIASAVIIVVVFRIAPFLFKRYGDRVIEPEIKFLFLILITFSFLAKLGASHAVFLYQRRNGRFTQTVVCESRFAGPNASGETNTQVYRNLPVCQEIHSERGDVHHPAHEHGFDDGNHFFGVRTAGGLYHTGAILGAGRYRGAQCHYPHRDRTALVPTKNRIY